MTTSSQTIAEQVDAFHEGLAAQAPAAVLDVFAAEQARFEAMGTPPGLITVGSAMPDGDLLDVSGEATSLAAERGSAAAVVVLYRGAWCPYCNLALRAYQDQLVGPLAERGVTLVAVSPERPDGSLSMREKHDLSFTVLSDPGNQLARQLGVLTSHSDAVRQVQSQMGHDVAAGNADGTDAIPMPTVALVDTAGIIRWIDVRANYSTRTEPTEILDAVDRWLA